MLKSNSKKAMENIHNYILDNFDPDSYNSNFWNDIEYKRKNHNVPLNRFSVAAHFIYNCFYNEKLKYDNRYKANRISEYDLFEEWCSGLPSVLDTCYYYNRSAVDDLGMILKENEQEKNKYTEEQAEKTLTYLIYRELKKAVKH